MTFKRAVTIGMICLGSAMAAGGPFVMRGSGVVQDALGFILICLGLLIALAGVLLIFGRDVLLIPWRLHGPSWVVLRCRVAGIGILVCSIFPLTLAIREPDYRVISLATFGGALIVGVGFILAARKLASFSR